MSRYQATYPEAEVTRDQARYELWEAARAAREALTTKLVDIIVDPVSLPEDIEKATTAMERLSLVQDSMQVPAYIKPVKRWAGGPRELDLWYWDKNSF